jgi:NAD-dependent dihydropyrimidine dehydrogenase PreA subunit
MYIDQELCKRCVDCVPVCPVGAIRIVAKKVVIEYETCVECGVCRRLKVCPNEAIKQVDKIPYPRILRAAFSDPMHRHESTDVLGRGTEEMKTNDVKNEFTAEVIGFSVELGRPGVGAYLHELDKITKKGIALRGNFSPYNPVLALMEDRKTGALKKEVLGEKVLSAIAEFTVPKEKAFDVLAELIHFANEELDTVVTISLIARNDRENPHLFLQELEAHGKKFNYVPYPNGKVNIGMAAIGRSNP